VKNISQKAIEHSGDMAKDLVIDVIKGKTLSEAADNQIQVAKKKIGEAIRGRGGASVKRKRCSKPSIACNLKKQKCFDLLD